MKIKVDFKIILAIIIFYITEQLELYFILMLFVFLHECGHLLVGYLFGYRCEEINIHTLGISVTFKVPVDDYNKKILKSNIVLLKKSIIAAAGPVINFILIILVSLNPKIFAMNPEIAIYSNLLIGCFNMIPIYPLDGGRILKNICTIFLGIRKGRRLTSIIMNTLMIVLTAVSSIMILYYKNIAIFLIVVYLWYLVIREENKKF
ncbi:MAG: M50 family metallopeptidase [Clostridia bacterium]|nr:M50 family metallopeptidase [Clostridia bacterium]